VVQGRSRVVPGSRSRASEGSGGARAAKLLHLVGPAGFVDQRHRLELPFVLGAHSAPPVRQLPGDPLWVTRPQLVSDVASLLDAEAHVRVLEALRLLDVHLVGELSDRGDARREMFTGQGLNSKCKVRRIVAPFIAFGLQQKDSANNTKFEITNLSNGFSGMTKVTEFRDYLIL